MKKDTLYNRFMLDTVKTIDLHIGNVLKETNDKKRIFESIDSIKDNVYNVITLLSKESILEYCKTYKAFSYLIGILFDSMNNMINEHIAIN